MVSRDDVLSALRDNEYTRLRFTKADGTVRDMVATLNATQLALLYKDPDFSAIKYENVDMEDTVNPETVVVFDLERRGWRSFRVDRLISFEGINT
jgi:hypothetical protein